MISLIAESKTMSRCLRAVDPGEFDAHRPAGEEQADEIMWHLSSCSEEQISGLLGVSASLARECRKMIYEFPDKLAGLRAIEAFTGVVFRQLDYAAWTAEERAFAESSLRIVSSLYGLLRPADIVRPYRLDYSAKGAPGNISMQMFWKNKCTGDLLSLISGPGSDSVIDLMPGDAAKCFDWKRIRRAARVYKVDFKEYAGDGKLRTPPANKLKEMCGRLLRTIITRRLADIEALKNVEHDDFVFFDKAVASDTLTFLC